MLVNFNILQVERFAILLPKFTLPPRCLILKVYLTALYHENVLFLNLIRVQFLDVLLLTGRSSVLGWHPRLCINRPLLRFKSGLLPALILDHQVFVVSELVLLGLFKVHLVVHHPGELDLCGLEYLAFVSGPHSLWPAFGHLELSLRIVALFLRSLQGQPLHAATSLTFG